MLPSSTTPGTLDILSEIEQEVSFSTYEAPQENIYSEEAGIILSVPDPLLSLGETTDITTDQKITPTIRSSAWGHVKFLLHYIGVSAAVFGILLVSTNWSAYWTIMSNFINPSALKASNLEISSTISQSKIVVHASDVAEHTESQDKTASEIKKQLVAENIQVREEPFSMKSLIPRSPNANLSIAITPYDNRIIIPKIGKNIPLVDVGPLSSFDFDHMENIFMQELEKWVVRYPGTALPGEYGNAFIFGHSSNYPWMKGNYNEIFALLDHLEYGDEVIIYYGQKKFTYVIREKKVVRPGDVKALEREGGKKELSLMTCWPIGTTLKRLLVFAELKE